MTSTLLAAFGWCTLILRLDWHIFDMDSSQNPIIRALVNFRGPEHQRCSSRILLLLSWNVSRRLDAYSRCTVLVHIKMCRAPSGRDNGRLVP
mmetsp:Transcript_26066/g.71829  ORF Transcript_26066/g.71829 Transcript_26066/m.71829 type:complete len:92 (-) Transcript_26066:186-461(-)